MLGENRHDFPVLSGVHAEGLFAEKMLSGLQNVDVELLVQHMRDSTIDRIDLGIGQKLLIIGGELANSRHMIPEPVEQRRVGITDGDDFRSRLHIGQMQPARRSARELAPHQTAADDAEAEYIRHDMSSQTLVSQYAARLARRKPCHGQSPSRPASCRRDYDVG